MTPSTTPPAAVVEPTEIEALRIRVADLECQLANREARIAALITAGDANGTDHTRPGWQARWANWMRAKGY
jgi:hypothetical protein